MDACKCRRYVVARRFDLVALALEFGVGNRNSRGCKPTHDWHIATYGGNDCTKSCKPFCIVKSQYKLFRWSTLSKLRTRTKQIDGTGGRLEEKGSSNAGP